MTSVGPETSDHVLIIEYEGQHGFGSNGGRFPKSVVGLDAMLVVDDKSYLTEPARDSLNFQPDASAAAKRSRMRVDRNGPRGGQLTRLGGT